MNISRDNKEFNFDFSDSEIDKQKKVFKTLKEVCNNAIIKANEKANKLEPWKNNPSIYIIDKLIEKLNDMFYKEKNIKKAILSFQIDQKTYNSKSIKFDDIDLKKIGRDYLLNKDITNAYIYSDNLSKELAEIIFDYMHHLKNYNLDKKESNLNLDESDMFIIDKNISTSFTSRFKNFERDLLIDEYKEKKEDIDNKNLRRLIYPSNRLFWCSSNNYLYIFAYSPANEQYFNPKLKDIYKAPNFAVMIYDIKIETVIRDNFEMLDNLYKNFMQFTYFADTDQNIINAMGEASLIAQYWYTESINRILKDHNTELKKAKNSQLLAEYLIKYILAAEIEGVELIEVYPFDRVFLFNNSIFEKFNTKQTNNKLLAFEGLLESKKASQHIKPKAFLGGETQFAYEWEREKTGFGLDKFNVSIKKVKASKANIENYATDETWDKNWERDYDKDIETVINNLITLMFSREEEEKYESIKLEYKSKYSKDGITYLYSSGTNLKEQIPELYKLQEHYLKNIDENLKDGIKREDINILFQKNKENYFDNVKVVLFSYNPPSENLEKGFTLIIIANDDVPKSLMEQKSEKDDLFTALKLLINQHFIIDQRYKEQSIKEQKELIDILDQTKHSIENRFSDILNLKNPSKKDIENLKNKIIDIINQDKIQMEEQGREATLKKFNKAHINGLLNSVEFIKSLFITNEKDKKLNAKFEKNSDNTPWDFFANKIYNLDVNIVNNRIYEICCPNKNNPKLKLVIDFNELPNFKFEWKESLFNDAIYVMLKNACEHSLEIYEKDKKLQEIFLDIYVSNIQNKNVLNVEFTNPYSGICEDMFEHINKSINHKKNKNKSNSTGIGVVTIRKRLDVTYGLDLADIKFIIINKNKIKSLLYFPIELLKDKNLFLIDEQCKEQQADILYLEDESEYYKKNGKLLKENNLIYNHYERFSLNYNYEKYKILITDLNILNEDGDIPSSEAGIEAVFEFMKINKKGVIIILSSAEDLYNDIDEKEYNYKKFKAFHEINEKSIYFLNKKILNDNDIDKIKIYLNKYSSEEFNVEKRVINSERTKNIDELKIKNIDELKIESNIVNKEQVDKVIFKTNTKDKIKEIWLGTKVMIPNRGYKPYIHNSETEYFFTKIILKDKEFKNPILKHETLRRNIILVDSLDDNIIKEIVKDYSQVKISTNGVFSKISHDILNKMKPFGKYTQEYIESLKITNNYLREEFQRIFLNWIDNKHISCEEIEIKFDKFINELENLEREAKQNKNNLGENIKSLTSALYLFKFLKESNDNI